MKDMLRQVSNLVSVLIALTVNILATAMPLNGQNTAEISDRFQVYFVPAGYVFSIWGIIYIGWIAFTIFQFRKDQKENPRLRRLGYLFAISGLLNAGWLFTWHYNYFGLGVIVMLGLLSTLIASYLSLNVNREPVSRTEFWSVDVPFSIYLGWITVASVANIADWLYLIEWTGFGIPAPLWAIIMIGIAGVIGLLMAQMRKDAAYLLVLAWSFVGIAIKQVAAPNVVSAAWAGAGLMLISAAFALFRRSKT